MRWSVSSQRAAGTVSRVTETDRRWTGEETCHRLTRLPAGGLRGTICFQLQQIIFLINLLNALLDVAFTEWRDHRTAAGLFLKSNKKCLLKY